MLWRTLHVCRAFLQWPIMQQIHSHKMRDQMKVLHFGWRRFTLEHLRELMFPRVNLWHDQSWADTTQPCPLKAASRKGGGRGEGEQATGWGLPGLMGFARPELEEEGGLELPCLVPCPPSPPPPLLPPAEAGQTPASSSLPFSPPPSCWQPQSYGDGTGLGKWGSSLAAGRLNIPLPPTQQVNICLVGGVALTHGTLFKVSWVRVGGLLVCQLPQWDP